MAPTPKSRYNTKRATACDSCRKKKIKCDAEYPQCNYCLHNNFACTYTRLDSGSKKRKTSDQELHGEQPATQKNLSSTKISMTNLGLMYLDGMRHTPDEGRAWIESRTGETINMDKLNTMELPWTKAGPVRPSSKIPKLPARPIIEQYVAIYCSSYQSLVFPVISKSLFAETLDLAYGSPGPGADSAKSCIYAFLSVVIIFGFETDLGDVLDCETYAAAAQRFTVQIINEMTINGLQTLLMLTQHQYFLGDLQSAAVSVSIASRLLFKLGAHTVFTPAAYNKSQPECHLRDLFWLCYSFDQDICLRNGQPPSISGVFCNLDLPPNYKELQDSNMQQDQILSIGDDTLPLLAISASRSTLSFLQTALPVVEGECFWVVIFYVITAILTLFRNILKNPLDPAMADLVNVLQDVPSLIGRIPIRTLTLGPMIHLRFLDSFTGELARLGNSAILKAEREVAALADDHDTVHT
ncbi:hypothetical protein N8T08_000903 [Aspergillus melleus]|uniref:Uncharacterized protein n=1 Tax=Aspergillus melleus TaxID=138277 RepID=A0ACC3BAI3_9EURO|nr:hypothetical protein N8T08_000903 [Aspergillus melleus]